MDKQVPMDKDFSGISIGEARRRLAQLLAAEGFETPGTDARLLVGAATGMSSIEIVAGDETLLPAECAAILGGYARRRLRHEPVSRILSQRHFFGRSFRITRSTLDPRPETETLVELALDLVRDEGWDARPLRILDIGTGSGCILATLLAELPIASGLGTDISAEALEVARDNARRLGVAERAEFSMARSLNGVPGNYDLVVSNPPYIESSAIAGLAADVRDFDPGTALDGGADGLCVYREIAREIGRVMPSGWAVFEVGAGQAADVTALLGAGGGLDTSLPVRLRRDLGGQTRCVAVSTQR